MMWEPTTTDEMMLLDIVRISEILPLPQQPGRRTTKTFSLWNVATQSVRALPNTYK
jgi:hypothetical protein